MAKRKSKALAVKPMVVSFLLDETGSMASIRDDTIGGFNSYVGDLKQQGRAISFSLVKFDSNKIEKMHVGVPIGDVPELTRETYVPGAATPLIDATYKTITATREHVKARDDKPLVVVVVQTDGHENASTEHTNSDLHALIKELSAEGWQFVFLGAGIDAFDQASKWGISAGTTASYDRGQSAQAFASMSRATASYAATGDAGNLAFTTAERTAMGGNGQEPASKPAAPAKRQPRKIVDDLTL